MKKLKVGIAGYGIVGQRRHKCIDNNPMLEVVAVCDRYPYESRDALGCIKYLSNYGELLKESLDILFVCMTNDINAEVTIAGLEAGLHVFCEKPPGRDVEDIRKVIHIEKKYPKLKLMYGFNHRYHDSIRGALQIVRSGKLGSIINMRGMYGKSKIVTFNQSNWRTKREVAGGGVLLDQGIHMIDLMRLFAGEFYDVKSFLSNNHWGFDVEDNAYAIMQSESGVIAMINSSATQWRHKFNLEINLESGSLILGGILSGTKSYGSETLTVSEVNHELDSGDPKEQITRYNSDPSWQDEIDMFARSISDDVMITSGTSDDALKTMELVYRIYYADPIWRSKFSIPNPDDQPKAL